MKYDALIYDTRTGVERIYQADEDWGEAFDYMWSDGNYGCDCNRAIFFHRAGNPSMSAHEAYMTCENAECGDDRFRVTIRERGTERVLYADDLSRARDDGDQT